VGFDRYGHIELHPTPRDWVWIEPKNVKLVAGKKEKGGQVVG
jgi:hypothetical protein